MAKEKLTETEPAVKTTEELIADARAWGIDVTVSTGPKGTGEITPLPGMREAKQT